MPELPEIETIRLSLQKNLIQKKIKDIDVLEPKQFIGSETDIVGQAIVSLERKGKVLVLKLSNEKYISFHLKLTGQILFHSHKENAVFKNKIPPFFVNKMPSNTTRVVINFSDGSALFFNDLRKFGWVKVSDKPEVPSSADVLSPEFTIEYLKRIVGKTKKPIKVLLMDQEALSGLGNIYANDSLFVAGINPLRKSLTLSDEEIKRLYGAIKKTIDEGIKYKGSSARDELYMLPDSEKGEYQHRFKVYHREDKPCLTCHTPIKRVKQGGRSTFYCPVCQKEI